MQVYERAGLTIAGLATRTTNQAEADPRTGLIGPLYQRFFGENISQQLANADLTSRYGVYTNYASDHQGEYDLIVGHAVSSDQPQPDGLIQITIPAQRYLRWQGTIAQPSDVIGMWMHIWEYFSQPQLYQRSYTADFEYYDFAQPDQAEIWIAIQ
ncbi:effector binding domain-containing protein [Herpetosiphon sp.]|uniref:Transcription activator effector binding n=1 Tax=Herpetosiphon aurantiacus (strain ATCC 23779 / DSM 785 / 114-95) TaxID=316274 RepID=A9B2X0_HERA2|nr:effector binding domain-containing protein [Herpetosiphon sp.]ABX06033.1 transcription activator effector binding [Herpetosiphon aurantiacus DSM 785]